MRVACTIALLLACFAFPSWAAPRDPIEVAGRIDESIAKKLTAKKIPASPRSDDAEFLRRAYLDLHGRPPTADRAAAFLDNRDPDKRRKLIDELLAHKDYGRRSSMIWQDLILPEQNDVRFIGLVGPKGISGFGTWLADAFNENRPWDRMTRELLNAEGEISANPAVIFTISSMERARVRPDLLAVSTARLFLGVSLQCVECHDHFSNDWKQIDFWGLAAFFGQTQFYGSKPGVGEIKEGPGGRPNQNVKGSSITIPSTGGNKGAGKVVRAKFLQGDEPKLGEAGPYRGILVDWMLAPENRYFAPAAVNRWWGRLFGRGLTHPIDDMHAGNPSDHDELLSMLATELRESKYDLKHLIRCICNSETYQRSSRAIADNETDESLFSHMPVKVMSPDVLYDSLLGVLGAKEIRIDAPDTLRVLLPPDQMARLRFVRFFRTRQADATDLTHGIPQALGLLNSETLNAISPAAKALANAPQSNAVEQLYLSALARRPTEAEAKRFSDFLAKRDGSPAVENYQAILWILLNTSEFVLNR